MLQHILLIQDDAASAQVIRESLCNSNEGSFVVKWVRRCSEGLEWIAGMDAILVELRLPDSSGIETFDRLFLAAPQIPILVLSSSDDEDVAKLAIQHGAQDYLLKGRLDRYLLTKALVSMIKRAVISEALFNERERAQVTLNSIGDAVISTDVSGRINYLNKSAEGLTGWLREQALDQPLETVFRIIDATSGKAAPNHMPLANRQATGFLSTSNCLLIRRDGDAVAIEDSVAAIHDRRGAVTGAVVVFHDVSAARAMTQKMSYMAHYDGLTDLPNRILLHDRLNEAITLSGRYNRKLSVLFLDLDRFKNINDSLGHAVGDGLLQSVARRLFTCVRSSDTVSRQGGDEFVVLLWEVRNARDAAIIANKILGALRAPHSIDGHELHVTGSIGIVTYPDDGTDSETLMKNADAAMYHAKESGRDRCEFFDAEMNVRAIERQSVEGDLRHAIDHKQLFLHYQPKIDLATGGIIGVEALIRWQHPRRGVVPPGQFIEIAEDCGLIVPVGKWVLREACRQARAWQAAGLPALGIAINISSVELRAPDFAAQVRAILTETGLEPSLLELELTETFLMQDSRSTADVLRVLKDIGVLLALDDFGTGYSSLSYLKRFPIDTLKIDRSFVRDLATAEHDAGIVTAVIAMGESLKMRVVAEGVETREQLEFLQEHGCPQAQGYYFSRPVPAVEFGRLLEYGMKDSRHPSVVFE